MKVAYKKRNDELGESELDELVMEATNGWTGEGGALEAVTDDLAETRRFIARLVGCLAEKGALSEAELGRLLRLSNLREVSI